MFRGFSKTASNEYTKLEFRLLSWLWKAERTEPSNDGSLSLRPTINDEEAQRGFAWETRFLKLPLSILGLWPLDNQSTHLRFLVIFVLILLYALPSIIGLAVNRSGRQVDRHLHKLIEVIPLIYTVTQYTVFKSKSSKVKRILETIYDNWRSSTKLSTEDKKLMISYGTKTRMITAFCMGIYCLSCIAYFGEPLVSMLLKGQGSMKKLANHGIYPFPTNITPNYEIVYAMQVFQGILCTISITSIDGFLMLSAFHGCGQLAVLCKTICRYEGRTRHAPSLGNDANKSIRSNCSCLKCIVDRHVSLSHYVEMVDDVFHGIIMARLIMNTAHFCGVGYRIVKSKETSNFSDLLLNIFYMLTMTSNLFMYCWIGEQLLEEGENVGKTVYELRWYNKEAKVAQSLIMPILRSRRPMRVTAGKFFIMSLACYKEWFMKSVGYLSVLLAIKTYN